MEKTQEILSIKNDASSLIIGADTLDELNRVKLDFLGKSGRIIAITRDIQKLPQEKRPEVGKLANEIRTTIEDLIDQKAKEFGKRKEETIKSQIIDVTLPGVKPPLGHLHLVTQAIEEITQIFARIGFNRARYPEVEWDYYAFGALNFPKNHPARDDWETFFIDAIDNEKYGQMILTPHTSSGQIREMEKGKLPIKMINIAKCYRRQSDISHSQMFHQMEGLVIDTGVSITDLKGTLDYFFKSFFGPERKSRIRPYHFQFTEPSFEVDISCGVCDGNGCKLCKEGWLELGGAGIVHPNVLKSGKIDTEKYSGFAFGWGIERILMMREGLDLDDLRILYSNNLDFLEQF